MIVAASSIPDTIGSLRAIFAEPVRFRIASDTRPPITTPAAAAGVVIGGYVSDTILKRTGSANVARKLPIVSGMLLASCIILANYVPADNNALVIGIMSLAFFGQGMTNLGWTVVSDIAPKKLIGLTGGLFNFVTNLAGIVTPLVIGITYDATGTFVGPLIYIAAVALLGAFAYSVIIGDIHRLEVDAH